MLILDAHQHFWQYSPLKHSWINDEMAVLKRDFLPGDLKAELNLNGIDGCIAVQADQSEEETNFLATLANENSFIKGVVGWVDLQAEDVEERLSHFSDQDIIKGFRHVVQDEPDPDFLLRGTFQRGIAALQQHNFTYDILIFPKQLPAAIKLVEKFQDQPFVLDHIAKPPIKTGNPDNWRSYVEALGKYENLCCKISGMVTEASWDDWEYEDFVPYLDKVMETFGPDRLMFGSDWPVCLLAANYSKMKSIVDTYFAALSQAEQEKIFGGNVTRFYRL